MAMPGLGETLGGGPVSSGASSVSRRVWAGRARWATCRCRRVVGPLRPQRRAARATCRPVGSATVGSEAKGGGLLRGIPLTGTGRSAGGKVVGQRYGFRHAVMARSVVGG